MVNSANMRDIVKIVNKKEGINIRIRALIYYNIPLKIVFESKPNIVYDSKIISSNSKINKFIMRHMLPSNGHNLAIKGEYFTIMAYLQNGINLTIRHCRINKQVNYKGVSSYLIDYPLELEHTQQRDSFRAKIHTSPVVVIINYTKRHKTYRANILDLSNTGCKAEFKTIVDPLFEYSELLDDAQIKFTDSSEFFPIKLEVRHATIIDKSTICGFKFIDNTQLLQAQIDRNVNLIQMEARRLAKQGLK